MLKKFCRCRIFLQANVNIFFFGRVSFISFSLLSGSSNPQNSDEPADTPESPSRAVAKQKKPYPFRHGFAY